jgi:uncharacterized membrane protein
MDIYLIILRIVHILAGVLWVGSAGFFVFLVSPTAQAIGSAGHQFTYHLVARRRYPQYISVVAALTMVSGVLLFFKVSGGLQLGWIKTGAGLMLTIGSLIGILTAPIGKFGIVPRATRLGVLGQSLATAGGPPNTAQVAEFDKVDRELAFYERIDFIMLTVSLVAMAVARYWAV